jgi:hypothetical protein
MSKPEERNVDLILNGIVLAKFIPWLIRLIVGNCEVFESFFF